MLEPLTPPTPDQELALLQPLAARLIWWQSPAQSLRHPDRVIAQVMELRNFDSALQRAQPGWFSPRSWTYCQRKLAVAPSGGRRQGPPDSQEGGGGM